MNVYVPNQVCVDHIYGDVPRTSSETKRWRVCAGGYARAVWKNCFFTLFRNLIFSDPQRCARFPGSGNEFANPLPEPYFLAFPNGVLDFRA